MSSFTVVTENMIASLASGYLRGWEGDPAGAAEAENGCIRLTALIFLIFDVAVVADGVPAMVA